MSLSKKTFKQFMIKYKNDISPELGTTPIPKKYDRLFHDTNNSETGTVDFELSVSNFYNDLLVEQETLGYEFEKVLYDNLWNLYVKTTT